MIETYPLGHSVSGRPAHVPLNVIGVIVWFWCSHTPGPSSSSSTSSTSFSIHCLLHSLCLSFHPTQTDPDIEKTIQLPISRSLPLTQNKKKILAAVSKIRWLFRESSPGHCGRPHTTPHHQKRNNEITLSRICDDHARTIWINHDPRARDPKHVYGEYSKSLPNDTLG